MQQRVDPKVLVLYIHMTIYCLDRAAADPHGWVLLGEQRKYAAVSPRRLVVGRAAATTQVGASDSLQMGELNIAHGTEDGDQMDRRLSLQ
jgi:hypothetical protein